MCVRIRKQSLFRSSVVISMTDLSLLKVPFSSYLIRATCKPWQLSGPRNADYVDADEAFLLIFSPNRFLLLIYPADSRFNFRMRILEMFWFYVNHLFVTVRLLVSNLVIALFKMDRKRCFLFQYYFLYGYISSNCKTPIIMLATRFRLF